MPPMRNQVPSANLRPPIEAFYPKTLFALSYCMFDAPLSKGVKSVSIFFKHNATGPPPPKRNPQMKPAYPVAR